MPDPPDSEDEEGHRNPAFDTDIYLHHTQEDLDRLRQSCEEAADERPQLTYVIVDLDHETDPDDPLDTGGVVDVFGRLLREQEEAQLRYDRNEARPGQPDA